MLSMMTEEYQTYYNDEDVDVNRFYNRAKVILNGITSGRIEEVSEDHPEDYRYDRVKGVIALVIHELHSRASVSGVSIVSNDGYSEHYVSETEWQSGLERAVRQALSGTGLTGCM